MSIRALPLLFIVLILYNALVFAFSGTAPEALFYGAAAVDPTTNTVAVRGADLFKLTMPHGGEWHFRLGDLVLVIALVLLAVEMVKATYTRGAGLADQALSTILFVIFLVEFLLVSKAATSLFFFLTLISLIDVVIGSIVGIRTARRDIGFAPGGGD